VTWTIKPFLSSIRVAFSIDASPAERIHASRGRGKVRVPTPPHKPSPYGACMMMTTAKATDTILAIDSGKYKDVAALSG
jgi:hypothetical protein